MANVRLESPIRISLEMLDAMLAGRFTGTQYRILLALLADVQRAPSHEVCVSQPALAAAAGVALAGGFRAALQGLKHVGVIRIVAPARGRRGATYTIGRAYEWRTRPAA